MKTSLQIKLPNELKQWLDQQIEHGAYATASAFFEKLTRAERKRALRQQIDHQLLDALDSGASTPMTAQDWERVRQQGRKQLARKRKRA